MRITGGSEVNGNVFLVTDYLQVSEQSYIDSKGSGCMFDEGLGSPTLFVSSSFNCGLVGGSFGGSGGSGIALEEADMDYCIQNSYSRITTYPFLKKNSDGDLENSYLGGPIPSLLAVSSGSTGSAYNPNTHSLSPIAPGVITIISKRIEIADSFIVSGYPAHAHDHDIKSPSNSGGSVLFVTKEIIMDNLSRVIANG